MKQLFIVVAVAVLAFLGITYVSGNAAREFAEAGGEIDVLSPETNTSATVYGDNAIAVAITGDNNDVNAAVQPAQQPEDIETVRQERGIALVGMVLLSVCVIGMLLFKMLA